MHIGINLSITINNLVVSYTDDGPENAATIIFIHGFPLNKTMWRNQVEALKETYRVITYDVRGHGTSNNGTDNFSIDLFVNDLIGLMDALEIDKTILCGISMGGYIALKAIENHPKRFKALILCDTSSAADLPETITHRMRTIEIMEEGTVGKYADESLKKLFADDTYSKSSALVETVRQMIVNTSKPSLCKTLRALAEREESWSKLREIKVPVLIMVGREDKITPPAEAKFIHEKVKGSHLQIIENAGHLSNMEHPVEFNDHLKKFLSSIKPK